MKFFNILLQKFDTFTALAVNVYTRALIDFPRLFLILPLAFVFGISPALRLKPQLFEKNMESLFTPTHGPYRTERAVSEAIWPANPNKFLVGRTYDTKKTAQLIVRRLDGRSLLDLQVLTKLKAWNAAIVSQLTVTDHRGIKWRYKDICLKYKSQCAFTNQHLSLIKYSLETDKQDNSNIKDMKSNKRGNRSSQNRVKVAPLTYPRWSPLKGVSSYYIGTLIGEVQTRASSMNHSTANNNGKHGKTIRISFYPQDKTIDFRRINSVVTSFSSVYLLYPLRSDTDEFANAKELWEKAFAQNVSGTFPSLDPEQKLNNKNRCNNVKYNQMIHINSDWKAVQLEAAYFTSKSLYYGLKSMSTNIMRKLTLTILLLTSFALAVCCKISVITNICQITDIHDAGSKPNNYQNKKLKASKLLNMCSDSAETIYSKTNKSKIEKDPDIVRDEQLNQKSGVHFRKVYFDWVLSKPGLGMCGMLTAVMASVGALALWYALGGTHVDMLLMMPFLILAIGLDDMFILMAAWNETPTNADPRHRTRTAVTSSLGAVSVTSLTSLLSFAIGTISDLRSVRILCLVIAIAIALNWLFQLTFYAACMHYSGIFEHKGLTSAQGPLYFIQLASTSNRSSFQKMLNGTQTDMQHDEYRDRIYKTNQSVLDGKSKMSLKASQSLSKHDEKTTDCIPMHIKTDPVADFIENYYVDWLLLIPVKCIILISYAVYLGGALYGCAARLQEGLQIHRLAAPGHHAGIFYQALHEYFYSQGQQVEFIASKAPNLTLSTERQLLHALVQRLESTAFSMGPSATDFFLRDYETSLEKNHKNTEDLAEIWQWQLLRWSTTNAYRRQVSQDLKWTKLQRNATLACSRCTHVLTAFRFRVGIHSFTDASHQRQVGNLFRSIAADYPVWGLTCYHQEWPFIDQYDIITEATLTSIGLAIAAMAVVATIFFRPRPWRCVAWTVGSIVSIDVGVVGYMALWGVRLDSVSMVTIIMSIGLSVDYTAHVVHGYQTAGESHTQKITSKSGKKIAPENDRFEITSDNSRKCSSSDIECVSKICNKDKSQELHFDLNRNRIRQTLKNLGLPVLQGALSTVLGVAPLAALGDYIAEVFFKITTLAILFGMYHACILLPVVLPSQCSCSGQNTK